MLFKDIVGQDAVKHKLIKSVKDGRIAHAQLFTGPEGTGKLALAIAYAQYINCQNRSEHDSCGVCPSCHKYNKLIHPDLHFVFPIFLPDKDSGKDDEEKVNSGKVSDGFIEPWRDALLENPYFNETDWYEKLGTQKKMGIIGVTESSDVIRKISLKSYEADYKTMIIWLPERMNQEAANRLLKLIEEPPAKSVFLMVTENPDHIIKTILSRTQIILVPPISRDQIATALVERFHLTSGNAQDISRIANGNFQQALKLMSSDKANPYFILYRDLMRACWAKDILKLLEWVDEAASAGREKQKEFLTYALRVTRESFMLNLGLNDIVYLAGDEADFGQKFSPFINKNNILQFNKEFNLAIEHISRNGNAQIIFTDMALRLVKLIERKDK